MPDAHSIHESGRIIRRPDASKNLDARQIIIAKSDVRHIVAGRAASAAPLDVRATIAFV